MQREIVLPREISPGAGPRQRGRAPADTQAATINPTRELQRNAFYIIDVPALEHVMSENAFHAADLPVRQLLRDLRERAGLTQAAIAKAAGMPETTYAGMESRYTRPYYKPAFMRRLSPVLTGQGVPPITEAEVLRLGGVDPARPDVLPPPPPRGWGPATPFRPPWAGDRHAPALSAEPPGTRSSSDPDQPASAPPGSRSRRRRPTMAEMMAHSAIPQDDLLQRQEEELLAAQRLASRTMPVRAVSDTPAGLVLHEEQVIDRVPRPPGLAAAEHAFACYCPGTGLEPRIRDGELIYCVPGRVAARGDPVLLEVEPEPGDAPVLHVGWMIGRSPQAICLDRGHDQPDRFPRDRVWRVVRILDWPEALSR
jgi:hypothetical protein